MSTPDLADRIILAMGRKLKAKIVTVDRHFEGLEDAIWIGAD